MSLKVSTKHNCLHTLYRSKFSVASRGFFATARLLSYCAWRWCFGRNNAILSL